ncbi:MAG: bifunctional glycosyltransferase family 2/GtrA family protein [Candidatus Nanopelagicales bacterium]|jgi:putative flippase GtrA|nr:bifunctional glycosyltransferase family 2/GtrA family protein [Candidatus Nanopelagicales bacterium]
MTTLSERPLTTQVIDVEVVVPVYNEERALRASVLALRSYLQTMPWSFRIVIADNASNDATGMIGKALAQTVPEVTYLRLDQKGRGRALRTAWAQSQARVVAYMDVDLSTDLAALPVLVAPLLSGHSDVAIGTRLNRASRVTRGTKREFISRTYNRLLRLTLRSGFSDAQCGFKAVRADRLPALLSQVQDQEWFFDTELLVVAEHTGLRIHEVPVDWVDDPDSRVDIVATAMADLRGIARLGRDIATGRTGMGEAPVSDARGQALRFILVGIASTALYALLYLVARNTFDPVAANIVALLLATAANNAANRSFTFGISGRQGWLTHQLKGYAVLGVALAITTATAVLLPATVSRPWEIVALTAANLLATVIRFLLFRTWVFGGAR